MSELIKSRQTGRMTFSSGRQMSTAFLVVEPGGMKSKFADVSLLEVDAA